MAAMDYLRRAGLALELEGERMRVTPADRLTDAHRQYLRDHKAELLAELTTANDPRQVTPEPQQDTATALTPAPASERPAEVRRNAWTITLGGKPICTICGAPMTLDEALAEARWRWPDADIE